MKRVYTPEQRARKNECQRAWIKANKEKWDTYRKAWAAAHPRPKRPYKPRAKSAARDVWNKKNDDRLAVKRTERAYGLSVAAYDELLVEQGGVCAICGALPKGRFRRLCCDHSHRSGLVRGLLCHKCNSGLGFFRDRPGLLVAAIRYLRRNLLSKSK